MPKSFLWQGSPGDVFVELARFIGEAGAKTLEVGWEDDLDEPPPGTELTWYAEVVWPDGSMDRTTHKTKDADAAPVLVLADLVSQLGASVAVLDRRQ